MSSNEFNIALAKNRKQQSEMHIKSLFMQIVGHVAICAWLITELTESFMKGQTPNMALQGFAVICLLASFVLTARLIKSIKGTIEDIDRHLELLEADNGICNRLQETFEDSQQGETGK